MSYDLFALPQHSAADADAALTEMRRADASAPATAPARNVTALIDLVDSNRSRLGVVHESPEPHGIGAYFTASWSDVEASRAALIPAAATLGFDVYDPQEHLLIHTADAKCVEVTHGSLGVFPLLSRTLSTALVTRLAEPDPFLIVSRDTDVYVQTLIRDGHCTIEYRDGSADRHFAAVAPPDEVSGLLWAWTQSGPSALRHLEWSKVEF
ncbi:hypothetical protein [Tsukamurella spumae]|uniref:Uncharacterized protein n=1 Tax=Tsukamurella spumae TaxID=44753 RepID=A0A846X3A2_9ACTN|nr:hypothetical protein [Tsukamurella spumae]NKY19571.1 hypothetical protein [Tsukamurella spumae]